MKTPINNQHISTAKLPGKLRAFIFRDGAHLREDEPVYAVNWFNTKSNMIYDFYNHLAVKSVRKIGGEPFFKARHVKTLHGSVDETRDVLLLVRYPALTNFRTMLESTTFQIVSLIRMAAVKDFTFGFTKRGDKGAALVPLNEDDKGKVVYGVFHYSGIQDIDLFLSKLMPETSAEIFYTGTIRAHIATGETYDVATQVPCEMDGLVIFKSDTPKDLESLPQNTVFKSLTTQANRSFFGLYTRIL
ncbi:MAG: hypothetical protein ABJG88_11635 [Litorimonas sp.]